MSLKIIPTYPRGQWVNASVVTVNFSPGLRYDDTLQETEPVKEAIRRLPEKLYDERMFRISRALDLSMTKTILPKEEWTQYDEVNMA